MPEDHEPLVMPQDEFEVVKAKLLELENAITWNTSCTSCARVLDSAYAETIRREAAEAKLAEVREVIKTFFVVHGNNTAASLTGARDLAEGIRQVLDREPMPTHEHSDDKEGTQP